MLVYQRVPSEICAAGDDSTGDLLRLSQQSTDDQISRRSQWGNGAKKTLGCFRYGKPEWLGFHVATFCILETYTEKSI